MDNPFFEFEWPVAPDYVWVDWLGPDGSPVRAGKQELERPNTSTSLSVEEQEAGGPILTLVAGRHRYFRPMDRGNTALFRRFADLDYLDRNAILNFARQYGWLGVAPRPSQVIRNPDGSFHHAEGESHLLWSYEVAKMREAIRLWEHGRAAGPQRPKLCWLFDSHLQHVQGRMAFAIDGRRPPQLRIAPMTLLAAMWLQLAMAVAGNKDFVKCKFCERQIEISTAESGYRTNRQFCSQSCKTNDYRKRRRSALKLAKQGKPPSSIAKLVATKPETVRRWLTALPTKIRKPKKRNQ